MELNNAGGIQSIQHTEVIYKTPWCILGAVME